MTIPIYVDQFVPGLSALLAGLGSGTVTSVSVATANGVSGSVVNPTTNPVITLSLGNITPTSVAASGTVTGSNISGTNTGDQTVESLDGSITVTTPATSTINLAVVKATGGFTVSGGDSFLSGDGLLFKIGTGANYFSATRGLGPGSLNFDGTQAGDRGYLFQNSETFTVQDDADVRVRVRALTNNTLAGLQLLARDSGDYSWYIDNRGGKDSPNNRLGFFNNAGSEVFTLSSSGAIIAGVWNGTQLGAAYVPALNSITAPTGDVSLNSHKITNLLDPTAAQDAATKTYVDAAATGLDVKVSCRVATTANITLSGTQTIDGVAVIATNRVLVKNQTTASDNGIWVCAAGAWSRSTDADTSAEVTSGMYTFIGEGTVNASTGWLLTTPDPITLGVTNLTFTQFSGAGTYTAGSGLTLTGTQFSVGAGQITNTMLAGSIDLTTKVTGALPAANGGTGQSSYAIGDLLQGSGATALSKLSAGAAGSFLRGAGAATLLAWSTLILPNAATADQIVFATAANTWGGSASFKYNDTSKRMTVDGAILSTPDSTSIFLGPAPAAGYSAATGCTVFGRGAGGALTTGADNTFIGRNAGAATTTVLGNVFVGDRAGAANVTGTENTYVGLIAGANYLGSFNTYIGARAGLGSGAANGFGNVAVGSNMFENISTGFGNNVIGYAVGNGITTGSQNTVMGYAAGGSGNLSAVTCYGYSTGQNQNSSASANTFIGAGCGSANTSGVGNTGVGSSSAYQVTTGVENTYVGNYAGYVHSGGSQSYNVILGSHSCFLGVPSNGVFIGYGTNYNGSNGDGCVMIGYQAGYQDTNANRLYIANTNTTTPLIYGEFDNKILRVYGRIGARATTEQGRFEYDASNYLSITIGSAGSTTLALTGTSPTFTFSQGVTFSQGITLADAKNIVANATTGSSFGGATTQKISFYGVTPIVQPINTVAIDTLLVNLGLRATGANANFDTAVVNSLPLRLKGYTVATLPAGTAGDTAYCTDLLAPGFLVAAVGGGAVVGPVFYNGAAWVAY